VLQESPLHGPLRYLEHFVFVSSAAASRVNRKIESNWAYSSAGVSQLERVSSAALRFPGADKMQLLVSRIHPPLSGWQSNGRGQSKPLGGMLNLDSLRSEGPSHPIDRFKHRSDGVPRDVSNQPKGSRPTVRQLKQDRHLCRREPWRVWCRLFDASRLTHHQ